MGGAGSTASLSLWPVSPVPPTPEQPGPVQPTPQPQTSPKQPQPIDTSENKPESEKRPQDQEVLESGVKEYQKELPKLKMGMYVDISIFMKIGENDWNAVTKTDEPVEVVIGIPEELRYHNHQHGAVLRLCDCV